MNPASSKILRRWLLVATSVCVLTIVIVGGYVWEILPNVYTATAEIQIRPEGVSVIKGIDADCLDNWKSCQPELETIQSPEVLQPIIANLHLDQKWAHRFKTGEDKMQPIEALVHMLFVLKLSVLSGTNIVVIKASSEDPGEAAEIANAVADQYKDMRDAHQRLREHKEIDSLHDQIEIQGKVVADKGRMANKLLQALAPNGSEEIMRITPDSSKSALLAAKNNYDACRILLEQSRNLSDEKFINRAIESQQETSNLATIHAQVLALKKAIAGLVSDGSSNNDPKLLALKSELNQYEQKQKELVGEMRQKMQVDVDRSKARYELLHRAVDDPKFSPQLQNYRETQREADQQQSILDAFKLRLNQLETNRPLLAPPVRIISRAITPTTPSRPSLGFDLPWIISLGLFLGIGTATSLEIVFWIGRRTRRTA